VRGRCLDGAEVVAVDQCNGGVDSHTQSFAFGQSNGVSTTLLVDNAACRMLLLKVIWWMLVPCVCDGDFMVFIVGVSPSGLQSVVRKKWDLVFKRPR
jgi:hypothetical protein